MSHGQSQLAPCYVSGDNFFKDRVPLEEVHFKSPTTIRRPFINAKYECDQYSVVPT